MESKDRDIESLRRQGQVPYPDLQSPVSNRASTRLRDMIASEIADLFSFFRDFVLPIVPSPAQFKVFVLVLLIYTVYRKQRHARK